MRSDKTTLRILNLCALGGPGALVVTCVGWLISGVLPLPLGPARSTTSVVRFYSDHTTRLELGQVTASIGVCLALPMIGLISIHMLRMERRIPILAFIQLGAGATTIILNLVPQMLMGVIGYRPELRSPDLTQTLNDLTWLIFFTPIMPFIIQNVAIGVAILSDPAATFPRWVGFLNLLVAFAFVPDVLAYFFFHGPFAWNGIFVFWLALVAYAAFLVAMGVMTRRANADLVEASA